MGKYRNSREVPVLRASSKNASGISEFRKDQLNQAIESGDAVYGPSYIGSNLVKTASEESTSSSFPVTNRGEWRPGDGVSSGVKNTTSFAKTGDSKLSVGAVAHGREFSKISKTASAFGGSGSSAGSNVERLSPEVYSPLFTMANLNLPRDRITVNAWIRNFFDLHPIVRNAITLHATYPISKLNLKCHDRRVLQFFEDMIEEMNLITSLGEIALEYWKIGEASLPDSLVTMKDGSVKKIQDVEVGDFVLTHTGNFCKVVRVNSRDWDGEYSEIYNNHNSLKLQLTGEHPVYYKDQDHLGEGFGWVETKNLKENGFISVFGNKTNTVAKIIKIEKKNYRGLVYDLSVEKDHSYVLNDVVVHNCFPYAELDETAGKWSKIIVQNPDYIIVKKSILSADPIIMLRPDATLQRLVSSSNPADVQLRRQIPEKILYHVKNGQNIPLDNFNVSHLKMSSSPYEIRGSSIIVSIFKDACLYDKLRECYSIDTEILTDGGFKYYDDVSKDDKIATFNPNTEQLEYCNFLERIKYNYEGEMYNFIGDKIDICVTPNHRMWLSQSKAHGGGHYDFDFIEANKVKPGYFYKARGVAKYIGEEKEFVEFCGKKVDIELYLKTLGYLIAEGNIHHNEEKYNYFVSLCQSLKSESHDNMKDIFYKFGDAIGEHVGEQIKTNRDGFSKINNCEMSNWRISRKYLSKYFAEEIGTNSSEKRIPGWVKKLSSRLLGILLNSLLEGDGSVIKSKFNNGATAYKYNTISKQLADDVQEIAFKCGFAPHLMLVKNGQGKEYYIVTWSDSNFGRFPSIYLNAKKGNNRGGTLDKIQYNDDVFCFTVPNGLFVTRRDGKITIQGNCKFAQADGMVNPITIVKVGGATDGDYRATQEDIEFFRQMLEEAQYDKDFKLVTHAGITIERVGSQSAVLDIAPDLDLIIKNMYVGLMVPSAIIEGEGATYQNASIGLEVLRQRYFNFRAIMSKWLVKKIFAPIAEIQEFYEYKNGEKKLIVPEVEWNQMNLYDLQDYIGNITGLVSAKQASLQTLYRSLGLNYEEERVRMRQETIHDAIRRREEEALGKMTLSELRGLDPEKEIMEPVDDTDRSVQELPPEADAGGAPGGGGMPGGLPELAPPPMADLGSPSEPSGPGGPGGPPSGPGGPEAPPGP
jgi:intein/homing endonuclease